MPEQRSILLARRALLLGAASVVLTGCGIRLQDDAPRIPLVPTRQPIPAETALLGLLGDTRMLARLAAGGSTTLLTHVASLHETQADTLAAALERAGVPVDQVMSADPGSATSGTSAPRPKTSTSTTPPGEPAGTSPSSSTTPPKPTVSPRHVGDLEAAAIPRAGPVLAKAQADLLPTLVSLHAQRGATARALGASVAWPAASEWASPTGATHFLDATRAATYAFQVVAAQSTGSLLTRARATLATLARLESDQTTASAGTAPQPPLGYPLPFAVTGDTGASRLAKHVVSELVAAYGSHLGTAAGQRPVAIDVAQWLAQAEFESYRWGIALAAFPGLQ